MNLYKLKKAFVNYYAIPVLAFTAAGLSKGISNENKKYPQKMEQILESGKIRSTFKERIEGADKYRPLYMDEGIRIEEKLEKGITKDFSDSSARGFNILSICFLGFAGYSLLKGVKEQIRK